MKILFLLSALTTQNVFGMCTDGQLRVDLVFNNHDEVEEFVATNTPVSTLHTSDDRAKDKYTVGLRSSDCLLKGLRERLDRGLPIDKMRAHIGDLGCSVTEEDGTHKDFFIMTRAHFMLEPTSSSALGYSYEDRVITCPLDRKYVFTK